jgi:hypothetical protein
MFDRGIVSSVLDRILYWKLIMVFTISFIFSIIILKMVTKDDFYRSVNYLRHTTSNYRNIPFLDNKGGSKYKYNRILLDNCHIYIFLKCRWPRFFNMVQEYFKCLLCNIFKYEWACPWRKVQAAVYAVYLMHTERDYSSTSNLREHTVMLKV